MAHSRTPSLAPNRPNLTIWLPWLGWMLMIFLLSHQDKDASSLSSGFFVSILEWLGFSYEWLQAHNVPVLIRKLAHFTLYFLLFIWTDRVQRFRWPQWPVPWAALGWCLLYAISDEIHQIFVPGRGPHVLDVLLDSFGAVCGWLSIRFYRKKYISRNVDNV